MLKEVHIMSEEYRTECEHMEALYQAHSKAVFRVILWKLRCTPALRSEALDLLQDTFCTAWEKRDVLFKAEAPEKWLYKVAVNKCSNYRRKMAVRWKAAGEAAQTMQPDIHSPAEVQEVLEGLRQKLKPHEYELLEAIVLQGHSLQDVSKHTGVAANTLSVRLRRIKQKAREILIVIVIFLLCQDI